VSFPIAPGEFLALAPEILLAGGGLALLVVGAFGSGQRHRSAVLASLGILALAGGALYWLAPQYRDSRVILAGSFILDRFALYWKALVLVATALTVVVSQRFIADGGYRAGEYYSLILLASTGMLFMVSGYNLLTIWIALELMALSSYILAGYFKEETKSNEAALKYFVLGALSSGVLLYGISLIYGATGTIQLSVLAKASATASGDGRLFGFGVVLLLSGLLFKVAAVPFHVWTPDVYTGAPTPVTAYLAAASKAASFAILLRILLQGLPGQVANWQTILALVAAVTMVWGNLAALTQDNVKRMLAYSSIAHAGYILLGVLAANEVGQWAVLFYLLTYVFVTLGVFATVILLERREYAGELCSDYAGLARRAPLLAGMMLIFLLALTGIPPTGGFVGKFYLFAAVVKGGWTWLAVVGVLMSAVSLYYYFRLVVFMYQEDASERTPTPLAAPALVGTIAVCAVVTLLLGLFPGPLLSAAQAARLPLP